VWLRLYQQRSRPARLQGCDANRSNEVMGANWTLHDLQRPAAKRMLADPTMTMTLAQIVEEAGRDGTRRTGLALADRLGLTNPTFWRHFPDIAAELTALARAGQAATQPHPTRSARLQQDNVRLTSRLAEGNCRPPVSSAWHWTTIGSGARSTLRHTST
jgi:hypothetical protein